MGPRDLAPLTLLIVPIASFASIVASATVAERTPRTLLAAFGWIGWVGSVLAAGFLGLVVVGLGCWGSGHPDCGERASMMILVGGLVALGIPAAVHQVIAARFSSRGSPSAPRPRR